VPSKEDLLGGVLGILSIIFLVLFLPLAWLYDRVSK
tara:strand:- start:425 stop:532 length:108 start_codon:yes stop_codon:yes gene_type:complete